MLLDLSHYIFLFKMHQSSSFNLHCTLKSIKLCSGNRRWLPPVGGAEVPCAHVHLEQQRQPAPGRVAARSAHQDTQAHRLTDEQAQDRTAKSPRGCNFLFCV